MSDLYYGEVCWFDGKKGYGFLLWEKDGEKQKDLFVHFSDVKVEGFKTLHKGQKVSFKLGYNKNSVLKATEVEVLKH